ncbi:hypothetical protein ACO3UB_07805 [Methanocaldococcus sp. 16A]
MNFGVVEFKGHIIDSNILSKVLYKIISMIGNFKIEKLEVGKTNENKSYARILVKGKDDLPLWILNMLLEKYK